MTGSLFPALYLFSPLFSFFFLQFPFFTSFFPLSFFLFSSISFSLCAPLLIPLLLCPPLFSSFFFPSGFFSVPFSVLFPLFPPSSFSLCFVLSPLFSLSFSLLSYSHFPLLSLPALSLTSPISFFLFSPFPLSPLSFSPSLLPTLFPPTLSTQSLFFPSPLFSFTSSFTSFPFFSPLFSPLYSSGPGLSPQCLLRAAQSPFSRGTMLQHQMPVLEGCSQTLSEGTGTRVRVQTCFSRSPRLSQVGSSISLSVQSTFWEPLAWRRLKQGFFSAAVASPWGNTTPKYFTSQ